MRLAVAERYRDGTVQLRAIASRDMPSSDQRVQMQLVAALLEEMLIELGVKEHRCVAALGAPDALMRIVRLPMMNWAERLQAARFEAQRFATWDIAIEPTTVRVHPYDRESGTYSLGVTRPHTVRTLVDMCKLAHLTPVAVEFDGCALRRAIANGDAILDIGNERTTLHVFGIDGPMSYVIPLGGAQVTRGIASDLSIDEISAERRKRILGCAGAGVASRDDLVTALAETVKLARIRHPVGRISLVGNGGRLPGLSTALEAATDAIVELPISPLLETDAYPDDVLRAAAPDWTLAASLATWAVA